MSLSLPVATRPVCITGLTFCVVAVCGAAPVFAGMPSFLPEDVTTYLRLREEPLQRLQAISFFLLGVLLSTIVVKVLWNVLVKDFPKLPRLTFPKAAAFVTLWGLMFIVVLTMISGARELMTPGAWQKDGVTYSLADDLEESEPVTADEQNGPDAPDTIPPQSSP